ncbi:MAG: hypothetical protein LBS34_03315 [Rickettsiales bacterium]|jgi:NAD+ synthase (glutamine-hydrolysing)|nr:hypothetical protein [Rickettsiales bacterium]
MKIGIARFYTKNGDIEYNFKQIEKLYGKATKNELEMVIFPRLSVSGLQFDDNFLNDSFLKDTLKYFEKILDLTENEKTKILIGSLYYEKDYRENNNIFGKILKDSAFFIDNGYMDSIIFRKEIAKSNVLNDYKYFDKNNVLQYFTHNKKKFAVLLSDDIFFDFNIFLIMDNKPDYIICLDSSMRDTDFKEKYLLKMAKFVNSPLFYINNATNLNGNLFDGRMILINEDFDIIYNSIYERDEIFEFEIDCEDGSELLIRSKSKENKNPYFLLKKKFGNNKIVVNIDKYSSEEIELIKNIDSSCKFITFQDKDIKGVEAIDVGKYINIELFKKLCEEEKEHIRDSILNLLLLH